MVRVASTRSTMVDRIRTELDALLSVGEEVSDLIKTVLGCQVNGRGRKTYGEPDVACLRLRSRSGGLTTHHHQS